MSDDITLNYKFGEYVKNSFFLVIPTQQKNSQRLIEFESKALQNWIAELPTANPGLATRLLHDLLIDFNTIEMTTQMRLDALELAVYYPAPLAEVVNATPDLLAPRAAVGRAEREVGVGLGWAVDRDRGFPPPSFLGRLTHASPRL